MVADPDYRALNKSEFSRELGLSGKQRVHLRRALAIVCEQGELELGRKARYYKPRSKAKGKTLEGLIHFSTKGKRRSAFFTPDHAKEGESYYIPGRFVGTAMHGDRVIVALIKKQPPRWHKNAKGRQGQRLRERRQAERETEGQRQEAQVVEVVERSLTTVVGTYHRKGHQANLAPEDSKLPPSFFLKKVLKNAKPGDLVVAEFTDWSDPGRLPAAKMVEVLGRPDKPGVDMLTVIHKHRLPLEFPHDVMAETELIDEIIPESELARREDWREREVFTIDPEDARDFDDAICVTELPDGEGWELAVHIADVSYYVKPDSALDREARRRGNSVYLADRVIPMIPEKLSNGVCSLNPHVDRLTHAAVIRFSQKGALQSARFVSAVINSCRRYTYEEAYTRLNLSDKAAAAFDDGHERRMTAHVRRAWRLASILRQRRFKAGCFDLDFPEVRVVLDDQGIAFAVKKTNHDESHQLIEEFMLAANEAVAKCTRDAGAPSIYRIHEDPDFEKLNEFADLARSFGHKIGDPTIRAEVQKLTKSMKGKPEEQSLKLALLKSMKRAAYSKDPIGHFGLAKSNYCHFTSPIRRYADLIVHRSLKREMSRRKEPSAPERPDKTPNEAGVGEIATHISRTERVAADAERDSQQLKMIEYLESLLEKDADQTFQAMVTEVKPMGIFLELDDLMISGLVRKMDLPSRHAYYFDRHAHCFRSGISKKKKLAIASRCTVRLVRIDRGRGFIDFAVVD